MSSPQCKSCFDRGHYHDDTGCQEIEWYCDCPAGDRLREGDA